MKLAMCGRASAFRRRTFIFGTNKLTNERFICSSSKKPVHGRPVLCYFSVRCAIWQSLQKALCTLTLCNGVSARATPHVRLTRSRRVNIANTMRHGDIGRRGSERGVASTVYFVLLPSRKGLRTFDRGPRRIMLAVSSL